MLMWLHHKQVIAVGVIMPWLWTIFFEEQEGKDRADYGKYVVQHIANSLEPEFGSGVSKRHLETCRQFYRVIPIAHALRAQLEWTHYKLLIHLENQYSMDFYIAETSKNNWAVRQLERQIDRIYIHRDAEVQENRKSTRK